MKVFEHEHPLNLIDLEMRYAHEKEESDEDEDEDENDDLVVDEYFRRPCARCGQEIIRYHRYYYECSVSCDYSIHKFCAELPTELKHTSHNDDHTLSLGQYWSIWYWSCDICGTPHEPYEAGYRCRHCYNFNVDMNCAVTADKNIIHHPSHIHPLVQIPEPLLCKCRACGKKHQGTFYHCTTCLHFIRSDCVLLPKRLLIQHTTNNEFSHTHALSLSYSFPLRDQGEKHYPQCRVCGTDFLFTDANKNWIYKCDKCWFYTHVDCATSRGEPFMSLFSSSRLGKTHKDFEDVDHPDALHLPFPDQSYNMLKHNFFRQIGSQTFGNLSHTSHPHPLILVETQHTDHIRKPSCSSKIKTLSCHNPMKKIELLCNGCIRPITNMPFYKCANEDESCNFVLHEWCTRLPSQVQNHPGHLQHTLFLLPTVPLKFSGVFWCAVCRLFCNGFAYSCVDCDYHIDVCCAFLPEKIIHEAHPNHLLWRVQSIDSQPSARSGRYRCPSCQNGFSINTFSFSCHTCDFEVHTECALLSPQTIRHKYDKHPLKLSYLPIENHKSTYFCEICETELNPKLWFYHCNECVQSIHPTCAPSILKSETAFNFNWRRNVYKFVNIKFGGIHNVYEVHLHPLSFVQGIASDGRCTKCEYGLNRQIIFKCLVCKFAIHFFCIDRTYLYLDFWY